MLQDMTQRDTIKRAMKEASGMIRDAGKDPGKMGLVIDENLQLGAGFRPTTEAWDYVKRYVDGELTAALNERARACPGSCARPPAARRTRGGTRG